MEGILEGTSGEGIVGVGGARAEGARPAIDPVDVPTGLTLGPTLARGAVVVVTVDCPVSGEAGIRELDIEMARSAERDEAIRPSKGNGS